jgi:uncharacterized protein DUF6897
MEELIKGLTGKKIDVTCGTTAVYRGEAVDVKGGVLLLNDDEGRTVFVSIDKISTVIEVSDSSHRPGFIGS